MKQFQNPSQPVFGALLMNLEECYLHIEWFGNYNYSIRYVPIYPVLWSTKTEFRLLTELLHLLLEYS